MRKKAMVGSAHTKKGGSRFTRRSSHISLRLKPPGKIFRDPVHRLIRVAPGDEVILDLIDTPELQRLRRIRQLGVSWLTYHGAEHSRFTHSLGVFNFAGRMIQSLQDRYGENHKVFKLLDEHSRTIKAAALIHDIGHLPFSHMLERASGGFHHEEMTIKLVLQKGTKVNDALKKHGIVAENVASIIRKDFPQSLAVDIVSSQLDADRMDYLLRDSYCTGVGYGEFDPDWLLHSMCAAQVAGGSLKLCLDRGRGLYAAERFIIARLHMYQQVYMHRVTRGFEILVLNLFKAATHRSRNGGLPAGTPDSVNKYLVNNDGLSCAEFLRLDESQVIAAFHCWAESNDQANTTISRLAAAFLNRERLYRSVEISTDPSVNQKLGVELEKLPKEADGHTSMYGFDSFVETSYKGMLYRTKKRGASQGDAEAAANISILLADPADLNSAVEVEADSKMLQNLDADTFAVNRLYYDRSQSDRVHGLIKNLGITVSEI